ncbi:ANR family transcriptional regulator [Salmonella enterica]|nr:ANR family transcriptional regulator [Salmonella enterica]EDU9931140.1 ANR family transcriptional regulator [Salmonella enterica subsp. enterica serovar Saintpaul]EGE5407132.1 ANR family transcriptional regulator [Salmonella enterica subsp. enterica]EDV1556654.1 ANR family transcriptional regulator [Salmonella enterica subsp. enterica serovar Saintpaul]EDY0751817.1 ANR family transcriptional regulator [Salmonella enterica subsp. enterica serovar Saintpaul]
MLLPYALLACRSMVSGGQVLYMKKVQQNKISGGEVNQSLAFTLVKKRRKEQLRLLALEASKCERNTDFRTAAELWLQVNLLSQSPSNRAWAEHRHIFCVYMGNLKEEKDKYGRKLPEYYNISTGLGCIEPKV